MPPDQIARFAGPCQPPSDRLVFFCTRVPVSSFCRSEFARACVLSRCCPSFLFFFLKAGSVPEEEVDGFHAPLANRFRVSGGDGRALQMHLGLGGVVHGHHALHHGQGRVPAVLARQRVVVRHGRQAQEQKRHFALRVEPGARKNGRELQGEPDPLVRRVGERLGPHHHEVPHAEEFGGRPGEAREEPLPVDRLVGVRAGSDERGALQRRAPVHLRVEERHQPRLHLLEELLVKPRPKHLQVELVRHVQPDGLVLQPPGGEGHHAPHLKAHALEGLGDRVHPELLVSHRARLHHLVHRLLLFIGVQRLHLPRRALQKQRHVFR
mmetsp:Transcript_56993/g.114295  ORF Transcript_56993/g.114295 Transcript_56993/m.114295 type:complete len:323 (+) Transcript_56993:60-1028(+)